MRNLTTYDMRLVGNGSDIRIGELRAATNDFLEAAAATYRHFRRSRMPWLAHHGRIAQRVRR
jgi:hypothetical protein